MAPSPEILAVVFDFDDTLTPDSTTRLLESFGYDTDAFWKEQVRALIAQGYDPTLAWLNLRRADIRSGGPLAGLTNQRVFGMYEPLYRETDALGSLIEMAVATRCSQIELERDQAYGSR